MLSEITQAEEDKQVWFHLHVEFKNETKQTNNTKTDSYKQRPEERGQGMNKKGKENIVHNIV